MTARYRLDPGPSRFTVQAFAEGLLAFFGHSPVLAVRDFAGEVRFDPGPPEGAALQLSIKADSLHVVGNVRPADRADMEGRMRQEVLETARYPDIRFEANASGAGQIAPHQYQLHLQGRLTLHGVVTPYAAQTQLRVYTDGIRLAGESVLRLSDYGIRPVTALGGAIKLKDQLRLAFDLVGWKVDGGPEGP